MSDDISEIKADIRVLNKSMQRVEEAITALAHQSQQLVRMEERLQGARKDVDSLGCSVRALKERVDRSAWISGLVTAVITAIFTGGILFLLTGQVG